MNLTSRIDVTSPSGPGPQVALPGPRGPFPGWGWAPGSAQASAPVTAEEEEAQQLPEGPAAAGPRAARPAASGPRVAPEAPWVVRPGARPAGRPAAV